MSAPLLAEAVAALLGSPDARPIGWRWRSIWEPRVAHTRGVYLLDGAASVAGQSRAWSLVLKVLAPTPDGAPPLESFLYGPASPDTALFFALDLPARRILRPRTGDQEGGC